MGTVQLKRNAYMAVVGVSTLSISTFLQLLHSIESLAFTNITLSKFLYNFYLTAPHELT